MKYQYILEYKPDGKFGAIKKISDDINRALKQNGYGESQELLDLLPEPPLLTVETNKELPENIQQDFITEINNELEASEMPYICVGVERLEDE